MRIPHLLRLPLVMAALAATSACSDEPPALSGEELQLANGKAVFTTCAGCHGNEGQGRDYMFAPNLTGLEPAYVSRQLHNFCEGRRGKIEDMHGFQMVGRATAIGGEADVDAVVAYVASLPDRTPVLLSSRTVPAGLEAQVQTCAMCHGEDGNGNAEMGGPALTTLDQAYIARQLRKFREGLRGFAEDDAQGQLMAAAAKAIAADDDASALAAYYGYPPQP